MTVIQLDKKSHKLIAALLKHENDRGSKVTSLAIAALLEKGQLNTETFLTNTEAKKIIDDYKAQNIDHRAEQTLGYVVAYNSARKSLLQIQTHCKSALLEKLNEYQQRLDNISKFSEYFDSYREGSSFIKYTILNTLLENDGFDIVDFEEDVFKKVSEKVLTDDEYYTFQARYLINVII